MSTLIELSNIDKVALFRLLSDEAIRNKVHIRTSLYVFYHQQTTAPIELLTCINGNRLLTCVYDSHAGPLDFKEITVRNYGTLTWLIIMTKLDEVNELPHRFKEMLMANQTKLF